MCVICVKYGKSRKPTDDEIRRMWDANPDGGGIAYPDPDGGGIHVQKALDLHGMLDVNRDIVRDNDIALYHFRVSTSGHSIRMTHPFPLSDNVHDLRALDYIADQVLVHNGVMVEYHERDGLSDTAQLCMQLAPHRHIDFCKESLPGLSAMMHSQRIIVWSWPRRQLAWWGDGWHLDTDSGLRFSNTSWRSTCTPTYKGKGKVWNYNHNSYLTPVCSEWNDIHIPEEPRVCYWRDRCEYADPKVKHPCDGDLEFCWVLDDYFLRVPATEKEREEKRKDAEFTRALIAG